MPAPPRSSAFAEAGSCSGSERLKHEGDYLRQLRAAEIPEDALAAMLRDPGARRFHAVRLALASHPLTPRRDALALVSTLFWRDLAHISADVRVHPEVRRAADRDLLRRLPELAVAERIDLAKAVGRGTLSVLRLDPDPRVLAAVLDNRFATEADVVVAAARPGCAPESLDVICEHPRWGARPTVRSALLRNPGLPLGSALTLLTRASREDLEGVRASHAASPLLRACAERVLADRAGQV